MTGRRRIEVMPLSNARRLKAKRSFAVRRVPADAGATLIRGSLRPRSGDVVLARVERLGNHRRIEQPDGRRAALRIGDEIVVAYANRYATDQYESEVPRHLGPCQLVASGGIASSVVTRSRDVRTATDIVPLGLVGDERGRPINVADYALPPVLTSHTRPRTIAVLGTSMNSGKTTTINSLVHSLRSSGRRPGATKVTGTGSGGDYWCMLDSGAHRMLDFTDAGLASTYKTPMVEIEAAMRLLVDHLSASGSDVNLVEIADGIFQQETARIIASPLFAELVDCVVFAAGDAMGAAMGVRRLTELGHSVVAVSGRLTRAPLAAREAEVATGLPVLGLDDLADFDRMVQLLGLPPAGLPSTAAEHDWAITIPGLEPSTDSGHRVAHHRDGSENEDLAASEVAPVAGDW